MKFGQKRACARERRHPCRRGVVIGGLAGKDAGAPGHGLLLACLR